MARTGRPSIPEHERRTERVAFYLTADEHAALKSHSETYGVSLSELARRSVLGLKIAAPVSAENVSQVRDLKRLASNLNALLRQAYVLEKRVDEDAKREVRRSKKRQAELLSLLEKVDENVTELLALMRDVRDLLVDEWDASRSQAVHVKAGEEEAQT